MPLRLAVAAAALLGLAWGWPIAARMAADGDFPFHIQTAIDFAATGRVTVPHFLVQVLLGALIAPAFAPPQQVAAWFFAALYALTTALVCWYVARADGPPHIGAAGLSVALAVLVVMAAPLLPRGPEPELFLIGYFPANAYHNPTMVLVKPLLVLLLASAAYALTRADQPAWPELAGIAVLVVLVALAKPNYLLCLVPVLGLVSAFRWLKGRQVAWRHVIAISAAAAAAAAIMYPLYRARFDSGGVVFAPLLVIGLYSPTDAGTLVGKLAASLAFPLVVLVLWPRAAWRDAGLRIAWACAGIALFVSYFMAESGSTQSDGNLLWTGQMAAFLLLVASAACVCRAARGGRWARASVLRVAVAVIVLALHAESGIRHVAVKVAPSPWMAWWP